MNSYTSQKAIFKHKQQCGERDISSLSLSSESHIYSKNHFRKNPLYFRIYADFEADFEIDISSVGNKTTKIYKQNPILNEYLVESEFDDVLKSGFYISHLGYNKVDWFVEVIKLGIELVLYFKNIDEAIIMTEKKAEDFKNTNICRLCEKEILSDKVRDHCHLTGKYRGPAHSICINNVTQIQSKFILFIFHNFSNYDYHLLLKN